MNQMIVIDQIKDGWCHLTSPDPELLKKFVAYMELSPMRHHRSRHGKIEHYDLSHLQRMAALRHGAIAVDSKTLVRYYRTGDPQVVFNALAFDNPEIEARFLKMFEDFKAGTVNYIPCVLGGLSLVDWRDSIKKRSIPLVRRTTKLNPDDLFRPRVTYADKDWEKKQKFDQVVGNQIHRILAESIRQMNEVTGIPYHSEEVPLFGLAWLLSKPKEEKMALLEWRPIDPSIIPDGYLVPVTVHEESGPVPDAITKPDGNISFGTTVTICREYGQWPYENRIGRLPLDATGLSEEQMQKILDELNSEDDLPSAVVHQGITYNHQVLKEGDPEPENFNADFELYGEKVPGTQYGQFAFFLALKDQYGFEETATTFVRQGQWVFRTLEDAMAVRDTELYFEHYDVYVVRKTATCFPVIEQGRWILNNRGVCIGKVIIYKDGSWVIRKVKDRTWSMEFPLPKTYRYEGTEI